MIKKYDKSKLIEILREIPSVSHACKKVGFSRATFYRLFKDDKDFRDSVNFALHNGRENVNDICESVVIKKIKQEDLGAAKYWLGHNSERYRTKTVVVKEEKRVEVAMPCDHDRLEFYERCKVCKFEKKFYLRITMSAEELGLSSGIDQLLCPPHGQELSKEEFFGLKMKNPDIYMNFGGEFN